MVVSLLRGVAEAPAADSSTPVGDCCRERLLLHIRCGSARAVVSHIVIG
jgi:hypothetical protein